MPWVTVQEAHALTDGAVCLTTVYKLARSGKVRVTRVLGRILFDEGSFREYLANEGFRMIDPGNKGRGGE